MIEETTVAADSVTKESTPKIFYIGYFALVVLAIGGYAIVIKSLVFIVKKKNEAYEKN